jgi:hypothetical protein
MISQYPYMIDVSGMGNGMQDTRSQDALHQALLLRTGQMNPQVQPNQQNMNGLAQALRQGNKQNPMNPNDPTGQNINPATGQDWSITGSGYAGNGSYGTGGIDGYLNGTSGIDNSALGNYNISDLFGSSGNSLDGLGSSLDGVWQGIGSIGDWFGSLFGSGGALEGVGTAAEEVAPAAAAAA